jgi:type II restriction/modification system DNA methylase subunit YeeA
VEQHVKAARLRNREGSRRLTWWQHGRTGDAMRTALAPLSRFLALTQTAKHIVFRWEDAVVSPEQTIIVFARDDDYFFGVVHSRVHELWARSTGTQLREAESGFRYTPTTCFETFPFPSPSEVQREAIATAAKELDTLRSRWLNPPEWVKEDVLEFPASVDGPWARMVTNPNKDGIGSARYVRLVPVDEKAAAALKKRTLTNLYNDRPTWLANAHKALDDAVFAAYGWPPSLTDDELLAKLLDLNLAQSASEKARG